MIRVTTWRSRLWLGLLLTLEYAGSAPVCEESSVQASAIGGGLVQKFNHAGKLDDRMHDPPHDPTRDPRLATLVDGRHAVQLGCSSRNLALASGGVALLSEFLFAALGFGPAVMYEICWQVFYIFGVGSGQLEEAVWNSLIMSSAVAVVQAFWLRKHLNIKVAVMMTLPLMVGLPLGTLVLEYYGGQAWVKRLLGGFFLAMVGIQNVRGTVPKPRVEDLSVQTCTWVFFTAFMGGFSRGLFGVSAPVSLLLLFYSLDKNLWRLMNAIFRIVFLLVQGSMLAEHLKPQTDCVPMYTTLTVGSMMGMVLGNSAAQHVSSADMQRWLSCFLTAAGLLMIGQGHPQLELLAAAVSFLALMATLVGAVVSVGRGGKGGPGALLTASRS